MPPEQVAIVILGAAVWPGGVPSPTLDRRIARGAQLAILDPRALVIGSGGLGREPPAEAEAIRHGLISRGIPEARIRCEACSTSTLENARFSLAIMQAEGIERALVVTDLWHLPRAVMTFRWIGVRARGRAVWRNGGRPDRWALACLREAAAMPVYVWRLWRSEGPPRARLTGSRR